MKLSAEELKVGKREVEYGGIRLRKIIRTEVVNQPVELQREEIIVERVPAGGEASDAKFEESEIYIPLRREEPVVEKTVVSKEEVRVGKRKETEQRDVSETLRREEVQIENEGQAKQNRKQPPRTR